MSSTAELWDDSLRKVRLAVAWNGLPPYGLNNIRALVAYFDLTPIVVGTRPDVSYDAIQAVAGLPIHWIAETAVDASWSGLGEMIPEVLIVSGWATPAFNQLGSQVRESGGAVIVMIDNRWRGDMRQWLAPILFRRKYCNWFKAALVPGKAARRFVRYLGIPDDSIYEGLYGGNPYALSPGLPLPKRRRRILFVGRFDERKGLHELAAAWKIVQPQIPGWELFLVGEGPLKSLLEDLPAVTIYPFQQPRAINQLYQSSRFLVLPSHEDHWGVVVHEAAQAGCGLLLSRNVGAREDLADAVNSIIFPARKPAALVDALRRCTRLSDEQLVRTQERSLTLAGQFGPRRFADSVTRAITKIRKSA